MRGNVIVFLSPMSFVAGGTFAARGLFSVEATHQALLPMPVYGLALLVGTKLLRHASEDLFRRIADLAIAGVAVSSSPAFVRGPH